VPNADLSTQDTLRQHVIDWLAANGINANLIPRDPYMTLVGDQLTTDEQVRNAAGHKQLDPVTEQVARKIVTYTITVPPPPDVAEWLLPRCPTCGR
jgi:uncharacterized protein YfaT (DUF1175 family)